MISIQSKPVHKPAFNQSQYTRGHTIVSACRFQLATTRTARTKELVKGLFWTLGDYRLGTTMKNKLGFRNHTEARGQVW